MRDEAPRSDGMSPPSPEQSAARSVAFDWRTEAREWRRPWKLASLAAGLGLLLIGAWLDIAPDWDAGISVIMATLTYLSAPFAMRVLLMRRWRLLPLAALLTWLSVDGCYWCYWHFRDPRALALMRSANAPASLALYLLCGMLWLYRGSLREAVADARRAWQDRRQ